MRVNTAKMTGEVPLVRCRNPWGNECEWKGVWGDQSEAWNYLSPEEKQAMRFTVKQDGEFWCVFKSMKH